jgi:aminopeptidase N
MENQTATTMGDFVMDHEGTIAHELAHQWWGDALTPQTFADIWLNEGFASYFDALFTEYRYGKEAYKVQMNLFKSRMNTDGSLAYPILDPPEPYLFGNAVYMKGAWILHMLRSETGDSAFKQICRSYFQTYNYKNVTSADLIRITEEITNESYDKFFEQWLNYGGLPVLIGDWSQEKDKVTFGIEQFQQEPLYQFNLDVRIEGTINDTLITVPLTQKYSSRTVKFNDTVIRLVLDPDQKILNNNNSPLFYIPDDSHLLQIYPNPFMGHV